MKYQRTYEPSDNLKVELLKMKEFISESEEVFFTKEDLKTAESAAYATGFAEGIEMGISQGEVKALRSEDISTREILTQISDNLKVLVAHENEFHSNFLENILRISKAVLQKSMPNFYKSHGGDEMEVMVKKVIGAMITVVPVRVLVSGKIYERLNTCLHEICTTYSETINLVNSSKVSEGSCEIEWLGGGAKWNVQQRYAEIEKKIDLYLQDFNEGVAGHE